MSGGRNHCGRNHGGRNHGGRNYHGLRNYRGGRNRRAARWWLCVDSAALCSAAVCSAAVFLGGCGAKTGLYVPDTGVDGDEDSGMDAAQVVEVPCVEVPADGGPVQVELNVEAEVGRADVVFLVDTTASMQDEIDQIRRQLRDRLVPAIREEIPDSEFGVGTFEDFPVQPYGDPREDDPFTLNLPMTDDVSVAQAAVDSIRLGDGRDAPESQVEALYQLATGEGFAGFIPPAFGCPRGGVGYACMRVDALPVVLLFTDAEMHNGPGGRNPYMRITPPPHTYGQMVDEINAIGTRVIGFDSGNGAAGRDLRQVARDTSAVDGSGDELVFDIGRRGERLGTGVVDAIRAFASSAIFDIDAFPSDPDPGDGVDVTEFVEAITPVSARPMSGVESIDVELGVFRRAVAGTTLTFQVVLRADVLMPRPEPQTFVVDIVFRGDGRTALSRRPVQIVIPGEDGSGCADVEQR